MRYTVNLLKDPSNPHTTDLAEHVRGPLGRVLEESGQKIFGLFHGLFGLATNELYLVTFGEESCDLQQAMEPFSLEGHIVLEPTVRPVEHSTRTKAGIYVFRWFEVHNRDVEEIAALSKEAWNTFEAGFDTEVQALMADAERSDERGRMLLITWYKDLSVWQASRNPPAEARENFARRHQLTLEARPIATRLMT